MTGPSTEISSWQFVLKALSLFVVLPDPHILLKLSIIKWNLLA